MLLARAPTVDVGKCAAGAELQRWVMFLSLANKRPQPTTSGSQSRDTTNSMKRLFGIGGEQAPTKSLDEVSETMDARSQHIDTKVKAIDHELLDLKKQMATAKGPGLTRLKQKAMMLLKQRKMLDGQCVPSPRLLPPPH
jgi:hypothetical protein